MGKKKSGGTVASSDDADEKKKIEQERAAAKKKWNTGKPTALKFWAWLLDHVEAPVNDASMSDNLATMERERVHELFDLFGSSLSRQEVDTVLQSMNIQRHRLEASVMATLRDQKLMKSRKDNDGIIICSFADRNKEFAPLEERQTMRDKLRRHRAALKENKRGIVVSDQPSFGQPYTGPFLPLNETVPLIFRIHSEDAPRKGILIQLKAIRLGGSHKKAFDIKTKLPLQIDSKTNSQFELEVRATRRGVYRANLFLYFTIQSKGQRGRETAPPEESFMILRSILLRGGDSTIYDVIKPTSPYVKKQRPKHNGKSRPEDTIDAPPMKGSTFQYKGLKRHQVPIDVRKLVESGEMENQGTLVPPTHENVRNPNMFPDLYKTFWQNMVWISELQAYRDVQLFDMENVALEKSGRLFRLYVSGLAEGRPSVLRGDLVDCTWKGKKYRGRVVQIQLLNVVLEFHKSFQQKFNPNLDRLDLVRFTITRTHFRTAHAGCLQAPKTMGIQMLLPNKEHINKVNPNQRIVPDSLPWASRTLNDEQKNCVSRILKGARRPLPYCIFGPPGTG